MQFIRLSPYLKHTVRPQKEKKKNWKKYNGGDKTEKEN